MQESQSYKYVNLLGIISKANSIIRENKSINTTLLELVDSIPGYQTNSTESLAIRITFNKSEYLSRSFNDEDIKLVTNFICASGNRGKIEICAPEESTKSIESDKSKYTYLANNLTKILTKYINHYEETNNNYLISKSSKGKTGPVSSKFHQRFLNKYTYNRDIYHDLMPFKVKEILLISSLYDAYSIESEGRFSEHMLGQYGQLNLTTFPRITGVSSLKQAMELLKKKSFELVIYMVGVDKETPLRICEQIKTSYPFIPVFLLLNNSAETSFFTNRIEGVNYFDIVLAL